MNIKPVAADFECYVNAEDSVNQADALLVELASTSTPLLKDEK